MTPEKSRGPSPLRRIRVDFRRIRAERRSAPAALAASCASFRSLSIIAAVKPAW
jgi:hypothetical protein